MHGQQCPSPPALPHGASLSAAPLGGILNHGVEEIVLDAIFRQPQRFLVSDQAKAGFRGSQQQTGETKTSQLSGIALFLPYSCCRRPKTHQ